MLCQTFAPSSTTLENRKQIYQFLDFCRKQANLNRHPKIASLVLEIPLIDPLALLHQLLPPRSLHFYFEHREVAIAAIGSTLQIQTEGGDRFTKIKQEIQDWTSHCITSTAFNPAQTLQASPHFFCSFTFDDEPLSADSPFPHGMVFLPEWEIMRMGDRACLIANVQVDPLQLDPLQLDPLQLDPSTGSHVLEGLTQTIWQQWQRVQGSGANSGANSGTSSGTSSGANFLMDCAMPNAIAPWQFEEVHNFEASVTQALDSIAQGQLDKIVLAHTLDVTASVPFQWAYSLHHLRQQHSGCYIFSVGNEEGKNFIGASPERLLSIRQTLSDRQLITDALAGSSPRGTTLREDAELSRRLLSNIKERHEHQVVVDFITQELATLGLDPQFSSHPGLLQLANIQHIHTPIQTTVPEQLHPIDLVAKLHPTPAVAGLPRNLACEQIRRYELAERSLYAAPLGWIDLQGNADFIVGIRSALLWGDRARLYAGAGIVAGSNPKRELAEVRLKLQALLQALI
jgi:menaquinone-specific isochorismate synthase